MSMSFSWTQIAQMLGVSHMTVYCRRLEYVLLETIVMGMTIVEQIRRDDYH